MLHLAVERQKVEAVDYFVKTHPESLLKTARVPIGDGDEKKVYPLWHNNFHVPQGSHPSKPVKRLSEQQSSDPKSKGTREQIRKLLVDGVIQKADGMKSLAKIFRESGVGLTCFDISTFTSRLNSVEEFIRSIRAISDEESNRHLTFEEVLRYADFPSLDVNQWETKADKTHKEVFDALSWLRDQKGVKRILSLKVLDRMHRPHNERDIAVQTRLFGVENLDWRFLDMAISYLADKDLTEKAIEAPSQQQSGESAHILPKQRLKVLHLYSSGKRAAVDHWLGQNGIVALPNRAVPEIYTYIENYSSKFRRVLLKKGPARRTRVAILDSGILTIPPSQAKRDESNGLWPRIAEGESFIDDDTRLPPWQFASDPHGTQIANVISAIDPHCEIYVAKVAEGRHGIKPDNVADVDIISMSFAIPEYSHSTNPNYAKRLEQAVEKANGDDIIQLCSHHDEGWNVVKCWPSNCDGVKTVVACNEFGAVTDRQPFQYHYQIPGIDIFTGTVPYLESKDTMSGSSVATAIAAGLASLSLSCHRLQYGPNSIIPRGRKEFFQKAFLEMSVQGGNNTDGRVYLRVEGFAKFAEAKDDSGQRKYEWLL
ncbi:peptidase S8/S53 domain-containing protein [Trichoderma compactum]